MSTYHFKSNLWFVLMMVASVFIHGMIYGAVVRDAHISQKKSEVVEFEFIRSEPPKPPPPPLEKLREPPTKPVVPVVKRSKIVKVARADPKPIPPPPANTESPPTPDSETPPIVKIGISLGSTTTGGGFAAGVGNSLYGKADSIAIDPNSVHSYSAKKTRQAPYVPASRVSTLPRLLKQPKAPYPIEAKKEGVEGQVILMLSIDETGRVTRVRVLNGPGYGLNSAAEKTAYRFRFAPAIMNGEAVSTEIRYVYTFMLE